jgi:hypothetical protein
MFRPLMFRPLRPRRQPCPAMHTIRIALTPLKSRHLPHRARSAPTKANINAATATTNTTTVPHRSVWAITCRRS